MNLGDCGSWIDGRDNDAEREERQVKNRSVNMVREEKESTVAFGEAEVGVKRGD